MKINYKKRINLSEKGFTIIELMLVISIILVFMGFLVPKFSAYQEKAKEAKVINTAKQIQTAAMASYGDNDGKFEKDNVTSNINLLTSIGNDVVVETPSSDGQSVEVGYKSDSKDCKVKVNADQNSLTVTYDKKIIYPRVNSIKAQSDTKPGI